MTAPIGKIESGVTIADLFDSERAFAQLGNPLDTAHKKQLLNQLQLRLEESPESALKELVQMAVDHCHADSAGISLEEEAPGGGLQFRWVAVAGSFTKYLNGTTPRFYSPCGTCLDRGVPQRYQVTLPYYNFLGVTADPILDGILIPWQSRKMRGTIWLVSHLSPEVFTASDYELMTSLARLLSEGIDKAHLALQRQAN